MGRVLWWLACGIAAALILPSVAQAQSGIMISGVRPELHGGIGWHGDIGFGGRVDIPVAPNGFIDGVNDEFALSPGGEIYFDDYHGHGPGDHDGDFYFAGVFTPQWNFYVSPQWSVFPELGLALIFFGHDHGPNDDDHAHLDLDLIFAFGGRYHWSTRNSLVMRLSWPFGLQIGVTF
ncbi:MAG: hypothetical protein OXT09_34045 [Myxococcales bacterium]|nr:hypothetical protein [Myxococcales bacterium]